MQAKLWNGCILIEPDDEYNDDEQAAMLGLIYFLKTIKVDVNVERCPIMLVDAED